MIKDFIKSLFICTATATFCYLLIGQALVVNGESMHPTVENEQSLLAEKFSLKFQDLQRGEIVFFKNPKQENMLIIKRVIGLPGEIIELRHGLIYINNTLLKEPYLQLETQTYEGTFLKESEPYLIKEGEYIMFGDNREHSIDSREWGPIKKESVLGRALFVYKPIGDFKLLLQE